MKRAIFLLITLFASGCVGATEVPTVSAAQLDDDDLKVLVVAVNAALGAEYGAIDTASTARLVTPDRTIRVCDSPQLPARYECLGPEELRTVYSYLRDRFGPRGPDVFRQRNRVARAIAGDIGGLQVVAGEALLNLLQQPRWQSELLSVFPSKHGVVLFSSPAHVVPGQAVVYVLHAVMSASLVHLQYQDEGWRVKAVRGLWVS